jgi:cystathionine beta-lyase
MAELELTEAQLRTRGGKKWCTYADDVLPMWLADMDFQPAEAVRRAVLGPTIEGAFTYPFDAEHHAVAEAFAARMRTRFGWEADADRTAVIADLVQGLTATVLAYSEPGDGVIVFSPIYPPFVRSVQVTGRRVADVPMVDAPGGFAIDIDLLRRQAARPDVRLMLLCNPHNPTGRVFTAEELRQVSEVALEHGVLVVSDEVHADLVYAPHRHTVFSTVAQDAGAAPVTLQSATKAFNLGGLRCAVVHFGSERLRERFIATFPDRVLGRVSGVSAAATAAAWNEGDAWLSAALEILELNRRTVFEWVTAHQADIHAHMPEGTYFAWLDFKRLPPGGGSAHEYLLKTARVALQAGEDFAASCPSWARLNFATSPLILAEALNRMDAALSSR